MCISPTNNCYVSFSFKNTQASVCLLGKKGTKRRQASKYEFRRTVMLKGDACGGAVG